MPRGHRNSKLRVGRRRRSTCLCRRPVSIRSYARPWPRSRSGCVGYKRTRLRHWQFVDEAESERYTREELLSAMTLAPCHVTGTHDPEHTPKYVCQQQMSDAFRAVLRLIGATVDDLPRRPHSYPSSSPLEAAWVERQPITFTVDILPGRQFADYGSAWDAGCEARTSKFRVYGITEGMKEPLMLGYWS